MFRADLLTDASEKFSAEPRLLLGLARIHDMLNDPENAIGMYKRVLALDASNIESVACLGAHYFYSDQVSHVTTNCLCMYVCKGERERGRETERQREVESI